MKKFNNIFNAMVRKFLKFYCYWIFAFTFVPLLGFAQVGAKTFEENLQLVNLSWANKEYIQASNSMRYNLDSICNVKDEYIVLTPNINSKLLGNSQGLIDFVKETFYKDTYLFFVSAYYKEDYDFYECVTATRNKEGDIRLNKHIIVKICEEYYMLSYRPYKFLSKCNQDKVIKLQELLRHLPCEDL